MKKIIRITLLLICGLLFFPAVQAEWLESNSEVEISKSKAALDRINRVLFSYLEVRNIGDSVIEAGSRLVIQGSTIPVINSDGINSAGKLYFEIDSNIEIGSSFKKRIDFQLARSLLTYSVAFEKEIVINGKIEIGAISQAKVEITGFDGQQLTNVLVSQKSNLIDDAGSFTWSTGVVELPQIFLVSGFGGVEVDTNLDGIAGDTSTNKTLIRSIVPKSYLRL